MYQGFYNLTSGMLTQNRNLNVISNNMVNIQTPGYKRDTMVTSTFQEEMLYRTGRHNKQSYEPLGITSKIRTASATYVNYDSGSYEQTDGLYDFALGGDGFFCIETDAGERYTRNGSFSIDEEGYLNLNGVGRVLSVENQPILIDDEGFAVDALGNITVTTRVAVEADEEANEEAEEMPEKIGEEMEEKIEIRHLGRLKVVDFADYGQLHKEDNGIFSTNQVAQERNGGEIIWKCLEGSNVNMVDEMTAMMASQRALQSAAQALKMYDQVMSKSVSDVGRL